MNQEEIQKAFDEEYNKSPFIGRTLTSEQAKLAMYGFYIAGIIKLVERIDKHL